VVANESAALPSKAELVPEISPLKAMVRPVAHLVEVAALPEQDPEAPVIEALAVI
jgi:hypothetical protein